MDQCPFSTQKGAPQGSLLLSFSEKPERLLVFLLLDDGQAIHLPEQVHVIAALRALGGRLLFRGSALRANHVASSYLVVTS